MYLLPNSQIFPDPQNATEEGLLAIGGDLTPRRLLEAYKQGIFPWYEGDIILWWCPDPRCVLFPEDLKINKTVRKLLKEEAFEFTTNTAFAKVIHHCKHIPREGQEGTWITSEMEDAYCRMHELGFAHSAEVWKDGELAGGLYGVRIGKVFYGESMFSFTSNASRYAFVKYVQQLKEEGVALIDCQVHTSYLESFGAKMVPRTDFIERLRSLI